MAEKKDMQKELLELEALELEVTNRRKALRDDAIRQAQSIINQFSLQPTDFHFGEVEPLRKGRRGPVRPKYRGPQAKCGPVAAARRSVLKKSRKLARNWKIS